MDFSAVFSNIHLFLEGLTLTLELLLLSLFFGFILAVPLALIASNNIFILTRVAKAYIYFVRGTPLLVQLFLVYYGFAQFDWNDKQNPLWTEFFSQAYWCAMFTFSLNTAGYTAEIFRGAIIRTPKGEIEAGRACGMSAFTLYQRIILPNAFRRAIPAYGNETIFMLHGTPLASIITVEELFGVTNIIRSRYFIDLEPLLFATVIYMLITFSIVGLFYVTERKFLRHLRVNSR